MISDYLHTEAIGTIASKIRVIKQKDNMSMILCKLNIASFNGRVNIKIFNLDPTKLETLLTTFSMGDKIKIIGDVQCDAFINKDKIVKGVCLIPTSIELLEKGAMELSSELQIINK